MRSTQNGSTKPQVPRRQWDEVAHSTGRSSPKLQSSPRSRLNRPRRTGVLGAQSVRESATGNLCRA